MQWHFSRDARAFSSANKHAAVFRATQRHSDLKSNKISGKRKTSSIADSSENFCDIYAQLEPGASIRCEKWGGRGTNLYTHICMHNIYVSPAY